MELNSRVHPIFLPYAGQATVLQLGLERLDPGAWICVDADFDQFQANKLQAYDTYPDRVYASVPGSEAAQHELHELLLQHLLRDHNESFRLHGSSLALVPPGASNDEAHTWDVSHKDLWHTSLWVQEDICLMELENGEYRLTAASVCAPSNWRLENKVGRSLDRIHDPVPDYENVLADRVNRLFKGLHPEKPVLRYNWSVQDSAELLHRDDSNHAIRSPAEAEERYWRVERQTLRKLPLTGAVVFTIRIYIHSFRVMEKIQGFTADFASIVARLPAHQKQYKGLWSTVDSP